MKWVPLLVFALLLAAIQYLHGMNEFWDDTFIGMLYSRNIARGVGPAYVPYSSEEVTPVSRVEGYSNPLWVWLTAGMYLLPGSIFFWLKLASFLSVLLLAFACQQLLRQLVKDAHEIPSWVFLAPMLLLLLNGPICHYLKSGMETVTFTSLVGLATWHTAKLADAARVRTAVLNSLLWLAVTLTRPEGVLFAFTAGLFLLVVFRRRLDLRLVAAWVLPVLAGGVAFLLWRNSYYGEWLPNTFYAKVSIRGQLREGWVAIFGQGILYVIRFVIDDLGAVNLVFALGGIFIWFGHLRKSTFLLILSMMAANLVFVVLVGGDFWSLSRFLQVTGGLFTVLACIPIVMIAGSRSIASWAAARNLQIGAGWVLPVAFILLAGQSLIPVLRYAGFYGDLPFLSRQRLYETLTVQNGQPAFFLGKWLKENLPRDSVVGIDQAGQLAYYSELPSIDVLGLSDHHLARHLLTYDYLKSRGMTHLVPAVFGAEGKPQLIYPTLLADPGFRRDFRLTHVFKGADQHGEVETYLLFTRSDKVGSLAGDSPTLALPPQEDLASLLRDAPVTRLEPGLVRDLEP